MNRNYRVVSVTQPALEHRYIPLSDILDFFPDDIVGGANSSTEARRKAKIHWGAGKSVRSDIAADKSFFRKRGWVNAFYASHEIEVGDKVVIERIAKYVYHVYPLRETQ